MGRPRAAHRFTPAIKAIVSLLLVAGCSSSHPSLPAPSAASAADETTSSTAATTVPLAVLTAADVGPGFAASGDTRASTVSLCRQQFVPAAMLPQAERAQAVFRAARPDGSTTIVSEIAVRSTVDNATAAIAALRAARSRCTAVDETRNQTEYHERVSDLTIGPVADEMVAARFHQETGASALKIATSGDIVSVRVGAVIVTITNEVIGSAPVDDALTTRLIQAALAKLGAPG